MTYLVESVEDLPVCSIRKKQRFVVRTLCLGTFQGVRIRRTIGDTFRRSRIVYQLDYGCEL